MKRVTIIRKGVECGKCRYQWVPRRKRLPKVCPICKCRNWREQEPSHA